METKSCRALITGAGPAGLASALMLLARGWSDIVMVEQRRSAQEFVRGRAFNYQLDGRGQAILEALDFTADDLKAHGLPNDSFRQITFQPDGSHRQSSFPALLPGRKTPYWMTRAHLLALLQDKLEERNTEGRVTVLYDHKLSALERDDDGSLLVMVDDGDDQVAYRPDLLLGCDGLNSRVRVGLGELSRETDSLDFSMTAMPSPSATLRYKVLTFPANFEVVGSDTAVEDHTLAYFFPSTYHQSGERMTLVALPVPHAGEQRNINIILPGDHHFWTLREPDEVRSFLREGFPQLNFDALLPEGELQDFAALEAAPFPQPQYANALHLNISSGATAQNCLLLGDAAHAFPPDLGMGVNSALEEVALLKELLDSRHEDVSEACAEFALRRLPENQSLVRLVQRVHPYQYNQVPWRLKLWFLKFLIQRSLTRLSKGAIPPPGFVLAQKHRMDFVTMEKETRRAERAFATSMALVAGLLALPVLL